MINKKYRDIFKLNSFQPYIHGVWKNDKVSIGNEEALEGRNKLIIDQFEKIISKSFSTDEIKKLRLIDIGSYDGHLSIEIEKKFPFKEIVSLEPRKKNFEKGKFIREYLNVNTKVKFLNGNLEDVKDKFDIVFCVGVLHHLERPEEGLQRRDTRPCFLPREGRHHRCRWRRARVARRHCRGG